MDADKMRAEFEKWALQKEMSIRFSNGSYYWGETVRAWQVWQAAYAAGRMAEREAMQLKNWDGIRLGTTGKQEGGQ